MASEHREEADMAIGPHVFGDGRLGCWFMAGENFSDKLRHRLPLVRRLGVTDAFLPPSGTLADKGLVKQAGYFPALYELPPHGMSAGQYAAQTIADVDQLKVAVAELNIEGVTDAALEEFVRDTVSTIRKVKPSLRLRINVVPYKGAYLPADLFTSDAQLFLIVQNYLGNMDTRVAEDEAVRYLHDYGIPEAKISVMYGAHVGAPRVAALPMIRLRGSIYSDDLLADAGLI